MKKHYYLLLTTIIFALKTNAQNCLQNGVTFYTQTQIDLFSVSNQSCTSIEGNVTISESIPGNITNLNGLAQVTHIDGNLNINNNTALTNLSGLNNLIDINGSLTINNNSALINLIGLGSIIRISRHISISSNLNLNSLSGIAPTIMSNENFTITNNPSLLSLAGFQDSSIGGNLKISYNDNLQTLGGLENLKNVSGKVTIEQNPELTSLLGLYNLDKIDGWLWISNNDKLTSLSGLDNIDHASIIGLLLSNSSELSYCQVESICKYLSLHENNLDISVAAIHSNNNGCNDISEVQQSCGISVNTNDTEKTEWKIFPNPASGHIHLSKIPDELHFINTIGKTVKKVIPDHNVLDISDLAPGIYFIRIHFGEQRYIEKVLIEK